MTTLGELLSEALGGWKRTRGHVFWISNATWALRLYNSAHADHHPGLVCYSDPGLAPGTSSPSAANFRRALPFTLRHPDVLNGHRSTFLLRYWKAISPGEFGNYMGRIHEEDLLSLDQILGPEGDARIERA